MDRKLSDFSTDPVLVILARDTDDKAVAMTAVAASCSKKSFDARSYKPAKNHQSSKTEWEYIDNELPTLTTEVDNFKMKLAVCLIESLTGDSQGKARERKSRGRTKTRLRNANLTKNRKEMANWKNYQKC